MRNKHVGFVVEQAVHEKLRAIATREYISLSTLVCELPRPEGRGFSRGLNGYGIPKVRTEPEDIYCSI